MSPAYIFMGYPLVQFGEELYYTGRYRVWQTDRHTYRLVLIHVTTDLLVFGLQNNRNATQEFDAMILIRLHGNNNSNCIIESTTDN